ncbi:hypothetical protein [Candidatus Coxiella mudrowiae]|uniref:hypothetical protein n=1 Tax=Candidatus Coxiella mudrowiae TaxID=2054173 RepID=UPI000C28222E|nr:hypothetical protein [Candidatus Coxiella mudrowiae]
MLDTPHYYSTVGSLGAHLFRRLLHIAIIIIPFLYYSYSISVARFLGLSLHSLLLVIIAIVILFEIVRLRRKWVLWGQRKRKGRMVSSFLLPGPF